MSMPSALSRASFILLAVLLLCPVAAGATLREITSEDIASWREIREGALSADGKWLAYQLTPDEGSPQREATVILRSPKGKVERRYVAGDPERGAGQLRMDGNGRWIGFLRAPEAPAQADGAASGEKMRRATGRGRVGQVGEDRGEA